MGEPQGRSDRVRKIFLRPALNESLYQLSYPGLLHFICMMLLFWQTFFLKSFSELNLSFKAFTFSTLDTEPIQCPQTWEFIY